MSSSNNTSASCSSLGKRMRGLSVISANDDDEEITFVRENKGTKRVNPHGISPPLPLPAQRRHLRTNRSAVIMEPTSQAQATFGRPNTPRTDRNVSSTSGPSGFRPTSSSSGNKVVWLSGHDSAHASEEIVVRVEGIKERCTKVYRGGWIYEGVSYETHIITTQRGLTRQLLGLGKVDDAIRLSSPPFDWILVRSVFTLKFRNLDIPSKSYVHAQRLCQPIASGEGGAIPSTREEVFLQHVNCQDFPLKIVSEGTKLDLEFMSGSAGCQRDTKYIARFVSEPTASAIRSPRSALDFHGCDSCESRHKKAVDRTIVASPDVVRLGNEGYHLLDFVFIDPEVQGQPYHIGHVIGWQRQREGDTVSVQIRMLKRKSEMLEHQTGQYVSERELVATNIHDLYPAQRIMGHAFVFGSKSAMAVEVPGSQVSFWCATRLANDGRGKETVVPLQKPLRSCSICVSHERAHRHELRACLEAVRFPAADCYSGAGGFLLPGLHIFDWRSACDPDEMACQTLEQLNDKAPSLDIYQGPVHDLIGRPVVYDAQSAGSPHFPARGSTFMITGGPPCQGHSRASHANNPSSKDVARSGPIDQRNSEMFVFLALVAQVLPYIVVLENVGAFKDDKEERSEENANGNFARRAIRELTSMGYATRLAVINSRAYGTPQDRRRCFILAVKSGLPMPEFPKPSHAIPSTTATVFKDENGQTMPFYLGDRRGTRGTGAHPPVTINDAISDLPAFDYHSPVARQPSNQQPSRPRFWGHRDDIEGNDTKGGFSRPVPYASPPLTDFQRSKRCSNTLVRDQYTSYCTPGALESIFNRSRMANVRGCERRALRTEGFSTLLTSSAPGGKSTAVIHPDQNRKFTVAERKRAMGWPDWLELAGTPLDQDRLTGNGVCFESVEAIYRSIVETIILPWWIKAGRPVEGVYEKFVADHPIS
ncbi:hypothetical protein IAT40_000561 [Kwoniella sp. CBS 6097]